MSSEGSSSSSDAASQPDEVEAKPTSEVEPDHRSEDGASVFRPSGNQRVGSTTIVAGHLEKPVPGEIPVGEFDLVAVHGIYDDARNTWMSSFGEDFLYREFYDKHPRCRILTFSYFWTLGVDSPAARKLIRREALQLLDDLVELRKEVEPTRFRPIAFISLDLGGIIVKEALKIASLEPGKYASIEKSTRLMVFFGVPHRSSSLKHMEDNISRLFLATSRRDEVTANLIHSWRHVNDLARAVMDINDSFVSSNILSRTSVINIRSSITDPMQYVFDQYSATFDIAYEFQFLVFRPHADLIQGVDVDFKGAIEEMLSVAQSPEKQRFLEALQFSASPTCIHGPPSNPELFLTENEAFKQWQDARGPRVLHVHGSFGSTKVAEWFYRQLNQPNRGEAHQTLYFAFDKHNIQYNSITSMLTTILAQVFSHNMGLYSFLGARVEQMLASKSWTKEEIFHLFQDILFEEHVQLVINGLDQCDESQGEFLSGLFKFAKKTEYRSKVIIVTGPDFDINSRFPECLTIDLDEIGCFPLLEPDIGLRRLYSLRPEFEAYEENIRASLLKCGHDDDWAKLIINSLRFFNHPTLITGNLLGFDLDSLTKPNADTPKDTFTSILGRVPQDSRDWARRVLLLVAYTFRPLSVEELGIILLQGNRGSGERTILTIDGTQKRMLQSRLNELFMGLIVVRKGAVRFAHPELRDFLLSADRNNEELWYSIPPGISHDWITTWCVTYLSSPATQDAMMEAHQNQDGSVYDAPTHIVRANPINYCTLYWPQHLISTGDGTHPSMEVLEFCVYKKAFRIWATNLWWSTNPILRPDKGYLSPLPILASLGLQELVKYITLHDITTSSSPENRAWGVISAARNSHTDTVKMLLDIGGYDLSPEGCFMEDALAAGMSCHSEETLDELTRYASENIPNFRWPPELLSRVAQFGFVDVARRILSPTNDAQIQLEKSILSTAGCDDKSEKIAMDKSDGVVPEEEPEPADNPILSDIIRTVIPEEMAKDLKEIVDAEDLREVGMTLEMGEHILKALRDKTGLDFPDDLMTNKCSIRGIERDLKIGTIKKGGPIPITRMPFICGLRPLHLAARYGHIEIAKILLAHGASVDDEDDSARRPLHTAAIEGNAEIVSFLLEAGSAINAKEKYGKTALDYAGTYGCYQVAKILLDAGCNLLNDVDNEWNPLTRAVTENHLECTRLILENRGKADVDGPDHWTPLRFAVTSSEIEIARILLKHGANPNTTLGDSPILRITSFNGELEMAKLLIENGAAIDAPDTEGMTSFQKASSFYKIDYATYFLDHGADIDHTDTLGKTALSHACFASYIDMAEILIEKGADVNKLDLEGWSPLHYSVQSVGMVRLLLSKGADPKHISNDGYSLVIRAVHTESWEALEELLPLELDLEREIKLGDYTYTALELAIGGGNLEIVRMLLEAGARLDRLGFLGDYPLHAAVCMRNPAMVRLVLEYNPDLNAVDKRGDTPLSGMLMDSPLEIAKLLVNAGSDINFCNKITKDTVFCAMIADEQVDIVKYLLKKKVKVNTLGGHWGGPLHLACSRPNLELTKLLVENGADVNLLDHFAGTPLQATARLFYHMDGMDIQAQCIRYLLDEANADPHIEGGSLGSTLNAICAFSTPEMVKLLLDKDCKITAEDPVGRVAIHFAAGRSLENFQAVFNAGGDVDVKDNVGRSVLHWAVIGGHVEVVERILSLSRDLLDEPDMDGWTPLLWACRGSRRYVDPCQTRPFSTPQEIIKLLLDRGANPLVRGKGLEHEWSTVKLANFHGFDDACVNLLTKAAQEKMAKDGEGEVWNPEFHASKHGWRSTGTCGGCLSQRCGREYECESDSCTSVMLCYKCYMDREVVHPGHSFKAAGEEFAAEVVGVGEGVSDNTKDDDTDSSSSSDSGSASVAD
ncbi:ankyrin repeat-containing domain protein [Tricladium varicosporioides]|nr:ankyrin repeat-containing domain protein [Hymenoscyphus varicosporioides]